MSWVITGSEKTPVDPQFGSVSLLLHGDGTNGSTTITDSSPSAKTATLVGDAQISTAQSKFGGSSIVFDKVADRITYASSTDFAFGTGDFTIESWIYSRDVSGSGIRAICQISTTAGGLSASYTGGVYLQQGQNGGGAIANGGIFAVIGGLSFVGSPGSTVVLFANQWQHVALTRSGATCRLFVDGAEVGNLTNSNNLTATNLVVGGGYSTVYLYDGYIDEFRITKGVARYTANFTPPTAPFPDI